MSETSRLRWAVRFTASGPSPTCEDRNIEPPDEWGVLKTTAIQWTGWKEDEHKTLPPEFWGAKHLEVCEGDVLVTKAGPRQRVGVSAYVNKTQPRLAVSGKMILLRTDPAVLDPRYLNWQLATPAPQAHLNACKTGMAEAQMNFANEDLLGMTISCPSLDEQRRIANFLDAEVARIDQLASQSSSQQRLLEERFTESLRVETAGLSGPQASTGVQWMPMVNAEWSLQKISRAFRTASGTTPSSEVELYFDGPYPWVNSADLPDGPIWSVKRSVTRAALDMYAALQIQPAGTLVIAMYGQGETKGRTGVLTSEACMNQACCALVPTGSVLADFASYWFRGHRAGVISTAYGAGQPNLSQELVRQLVIPAPDIKTQEVVVGRLMSDEIEYRAQSSLLARRCALLAERRQALITAAVTGQIDVTTARGVAV